MTGRVDNGEWAVSYHGTRAVSSVESIINRGYDQTKTQMNACDFDENHKVYSTPDISEAENYSQYVKVYGKLVSFVFQNRINPHDMQFRDNYWGAGLNSMRAYGLLIKDK